MPDYCTRVCPVYLVDELVLMFYAPYDWANGGSVDIFCMRSMVLVLWELVLFWGMKVEF